MAWTVVAAGRVAETEVWRRGGWRTASDWVARTSGTDTSGAGDVVETAGRLAGCPATSEALRAGRLSVAQAHVIADAAAVRPDAEAGLVGVAGRVSLRQLREECRRVKNTADSAMSDAGAVHRRRSFRNRIGRDGAVCFSGRLTADTDGLCLGPEET